MRWTAPLSVAAAACLALTAGGATAAQPSARLVVGIGVGGGTVLSTPSGIDCGVICGATFPRATKVVLVARPGGHFRFQRWAGGCSGTAPRCTVALTAATVVVAAFTPRPGFGDEVTKEHPILDVGVGEGGRVTSSPSGIDCSHDDISCFQTFQLGAQVTLTATPSRRYVFAGWRGTPGVGESCGTRPQCALTVNFSLHVDANFKSD